jgi:hypothetical protein
VTDELRVVAMIRERDIAVLTSKALAARTTENELRKAAAVEKDDRLLAACMSLLDSFDQFGRKHDVLPAFLEHVAHVDQLGFRERTITDAVLQLKVLIFSRVRVVIRLERRRSGSEDYDRIREIRTHHRERREHCRTATRSVDTTCRALHQR